MPCGLIGTDVSLIRTRQASTEGDALGLETCLIPPPGAVGGIEKQP